MKATEARTLATKFKELSKGTGHCAIEIRSPIGNAAGERLQQTFNVAGIKSTLLNVVATPNTGILIETSQECAALGLSIQTAFKAVDMEAHLLVQNTQRPEVVVIHLNAADSKKPASARTPK
jgi:hypothetical protein